MKWRGIIVTVAIVALVVAMLRGRAEAAREGYLLYRSDKKSPKGFKVATSGTRAEATYHYYQNNDGSGSGACDTACADKFCKNGKVLGSWKTKLEDEKLPWTAVNMKTLKFPNEDGAKFRASGMCGRVVTIRKNGKSKDFRIVDIKGSPGFDLAGAGFIQAGLNHAAGKDVVDWQLK